MADWDTVYHGNDNQDFSRKSSLSSGLSNGHSVTKGDDTSEDRLILQGGDNLLHESLTDNGKGSFQNPAFLENGHTMLHGSAKAKTAKSPYSPSTTDSIPEEEISIPNDANISTFTKDQIANFFRCIKVDPRIISHLHRKNVDGKRFSRLKDSELENIGLNNPVVMFFRDKSAPKSKKKSSKEGWIL